MPNTLRPTHISCGGKHFSKGASPHLVTGLAKFDLANQGVRQPAQPHTNSQLLVFDETLAQPDFAVVNCSDVVMSVFHSPVLTRSLIFLHL